jgi:PKD domain
MTSSKLNPRSAALGLPVGHKAASADWGRHVKADASRGRWAWSAVFCAVLVVACGGNSGGSSGANNAPIANAGPGQTAAAGTTVTLDGRSSADPDGDPLSYSWVITVRPPTSAAILSSATSATPTFVPDAQGDYTISLIVTDSRLATSAAASNVVVRVTGGNLPPAANAGPDQSVVVGQTVSLDGVQSTDANRDALTYRWSVRKPDNVTVITPTGSTSALASFVPDVAGTYVASLIVNDGLSDSSADTVTILVGTGNVPPSAHAGPHTPNNEGRARYVLLNTASPTPVVLDGSLSRDANGDSLTFAWSLLSRPPGSAATLNANATSPAQPSFIPDVVGTYRPSLTTSDRLSAGAPAAATIIVGTGNVQPNAVAGAFYQTVVAGTTVTLDGSRSNDGNVSDTLQLSWSLVSKPAGSTAVLSSPVAVRPTFVADRAGVYVASLVANDGQLSSIPDATAVVALAQAGPFDGNWRGTTNQGGLVTFGVNASQISSITFRWFPTGGICATAGTFVDTTYTFVPPKPMESGSFTITETRGEVRAISATFPTATTASGSFNLQYTSATGCVETVPVTFTATR